MRPSLDMRRRMRPGDLGLSNLVCVLRVRAGSGDREGADYLIRSDWKQTDSSPD
jgi:hypothetical protein